MIKGLMGGANIVVNGGNTSMPYVSMSNGNMSNPMQGMLRINGSDMQVWDGSGWITISTSYATVDLSPDAQSVLQWAREQRDKQLEYVRMAKDNPAVQNALNAIKHAEAQLDLIAKLSKDYENEGVVTSP